MRTPSPALLLLALALATGCGQQDAGAAPPAAGAAASDARPAPPAAAPDSNRGASAAEGATPEAPEAPAGEAKATPLDGEAKATPLTGEAALAALRANVAETAARAEHADEIVEVTHILVAFEGAARSRVTGRTRDEAEQRAAGFLARVLAGEDFEAVRAPDTDDPGPPTYRMALGQSAGAYPRGGMAPAFGDVGWRLEVGEVGVAAHDPQASPFGWHIIKRVQ